MNQATLRRLFWICSILSVVEINARTEVTEEEKASALVNPSFDLCEQKQCLQVEDIFYQSVSLYVNPCDDFFGFACNRTYTASKDYEDFSTNPDQVIDDLRNLLDPPEYDQNVRKVDQGNEAFALEKRIFKMCKEGGAFGTHEKQYYLHTILPRFGANRLLPEYSYTPHQVQYWDEADLAYAQKGFGFAFFDVEIYEQSTNDAYGYRNPCLNGRCILIKPPKYKITDLQNLLRVFFNSDSLYKHKKLNQLIGQLVDPLVKAQIRLEQTPVNITFSSISEWQKDHSFHAFKNAKIDWLNYLKKLFDKVIQERRVQVHANMIIAIQDPQYFFDIGYILKDTDVDAIVDYVHLHFVSQSVGLVEPTKYREYSMLPQFKGLTCTPGLLAGTTYRYSDEWFPEENRQLLETVLSKVKNAVIARVRDAMMKVPIDHMMHQRMKGFVEEYENARIYLGYPNWLMNGTTAFSIYGVTTTGHSSQFYDHQANLIEHLLRVKLLPLITPNMPIFDPTELSKGFESNKIEILTHTKLIDGFPPTKEIVIPFGYFNEKDYRFFSSQLFDPVNYGAAATEFAFKLYSDLLDDNTYFENAPRCIKEQVPINFDDGGKVFIKRGVSYLLALDAAHKAWPSKNSYPIQFVDFGAVTDGDLFFLSFAKSLCAIPPRQNQMDEDSERNPYRIDNQRKLPDYMNFALRNFHPFLENFVCQKNHKLYRETKCDPLEFHLNRYITNK